MIISLLWEGNPFINCSAFGLDEVLGGDLLGEETMRFSAIAEEQKTAAITHRNGKPRVRE